MGRMEEGAAAAAGDVVALAFEEAGIMMAVAAQDELELVPLARDRRGEALEIGHGRIFRVRVVGGHIFPVRRAGAQDELRSGLHPILGDELKEVDLRLVDIAFELAVGAPQPPAVRQAQREIAARLLGLPAADDVARCRFTAASPGGLTVRRQNRWKKVLRPSYQS